MTSVFARVLRQLSDTAAPILFDVPRQLDHLRLGCRRAEEEPLIRSRRDH